MKKSLSERDICTKFTTPAVEVVEYSRGRIAKPTKIYKFRSQEPTWGDVNLLLRVIPSLGIANSLQLTAAFGISAQAPSHLHSVRNACYHLNVETMNRVRSLLPFYLGAIQHHPSELIWCLIPGTHSEAILYWIDELEIIADLST